jgi:hypothetical protein
VGIIPLVARSDILLVFVSFILQEAITNRPQDAILPTFELYEIWVSISDYRPATN